MFKKAAADLLISKKDDFDRVLKASRQRQLEEISSALKQFPYFDTWSDATVKECCMLSDTATFSPQEIILGKGFGKLASAHFVVSGTCSMVQRLVPSRGSPVQPWVQPCATTEPKPLFMQVCMFARGGSFNLGESLVERTVVAESEVRLLRIPLYLLRQHNVANIWHRIRQFLESRLPSDQQLLQRFVDARRWGDYRRHLCTVLRSSAAPHDTSLHDAPYYWRVMHLDPPLSTPHSPKNPQPSQVIVK